jgi:hypothetical protein
VSDLTDLEKLGVHQWQLDHFSQFPDLITQPTNTRE